MTTRIKGDHGTLVLQLGTVDYTAEVGKLELKSEDAKADYTTFADAAAGGSRDFYFDIEAVASLDTTSLWTYLWDNSGTTVAYTYAPLGNSAASTSAPHFTGSVKIGVKPDLGGEAGSTWTFTYRLDCTETPTKVTV